MIRASNNDCECRDDSLQTRSDAHSAARNRQEQHDMRHVRNPVSEKRCDAPKRCPPADNDIHTGLQRHPHRPTATSTPADAYEQRETEVPQGRAGERRPISSCFFTANGGLFERPKAAFIYRRGGCRHAVHDGGDGGDDTEEDSFSDSRHHRTRQGEADSHRHGFSCLCHPLIDAINGG